MFTVTTCSECEMCYVKELPDNEREHRVYHDQVVNGVIAHPSGMDEVIWKNDDGRITLVTACSPSAQRKRVEQVASVANVEMHCTAGIWHASEFPGERNTHLFLHHVGCRVAGFIMFEKRHRIWRCCWCNDGSPECEELVGHEPMWSAVFVWVHKSYRRRGVAVRLFTEAVEFLNADRDSVGLYTPLTSDGEAFVRHLYPDVFYIAK